MFFVCKHYESIERTVSVKQYETPELTIKKQQY